jgi:hypothetical protein
MDGGRLDRARRKTSGLAVVAACAGCSVWEGSSHRAQPEGVPRFGALVPGRTERISGCSRPSTTPPGAGGTTTQRLRYVAVAGFEVKPASLRRPVSATLDNAPCV